MPPKKQEPQESLLGLIEGDGLLPPVNVRRKWIDGVPEDVRVQLIDVRERWRRGELKDTPNRMARKIRAALQAMGVSHVPGITSLNNWLQG